MESIQRNDLRKRQRRELIGWIELGRWSLVAVVGLSLLNQILLACSVNYHFFFSAAMPYYLNWLATALGESAGAYRALAVILTVALYAGYAACWLLSPQRKEWMLAALALYGVDTVLLIVFALTLVENSASCLLEVVTHIPVLLALWVALQASGKLERLRARRTEEQ